jgi:hypothetical protein
MCRHAVRRPSALPSFTWSVSIRLRAAETKRLRPLDAALPLPHSESQRPQRRHEGKETPITTRFATVGSFYPNQQAAVVCYGAQFVTKRAEAGRRFMKAYLQGVRDYNDALKDGRIAAPSAEDVIDAIARYSVTKDRDLIKTVIPAALHPDGEVNVDGLARTWHSSTSWAWSKVTSRLRISSICHSRGRRRPSPDPTRGVRAEVRQYRIL